MPKIFLALTDVIKTESESWSIENVSVKNNDELDPSEMYVISSTTLFQTNVLALKKEGLILDLNPEIFQGRIRNRQICQVHTDHRGIPLTLDRMSIIGCSATQHIRE